MPRSLPRMACCRGSLMTTDPRARSRPRESTMPRDSKSGERRGGRKRATPNRRTILTDRILAAVSAHPAASSPRELILTLVKDQALPAAIRMAVARKSFAERPSRSGKARAARSSAGSLRSTKSASPTRPGVEPATRTTDKTTTRAPRREGGIGDSNQLSGIAG